MVALACPAQIWSRQVTRAKPAATRIDAIANRSCRRLIRYQALTLSTRKAPASHAPSTVCVSRTTDDGLNTIAQKSTISARGPDGPATMWYPAGVCIHELATTIQIALKWAPRHTISVLKKGTRGGRRSQPKSRRARKPDSRKNAKMPSAARALPKTSPTKRE